MGEQTRTATEPVTQDDPLAKRGRAGALLLAALMLPIGVAAGIYFGDDLRATLGASAGGDEGSDATQAAAKELWTCGMHPQVIRDGPGTCPICGMKLEPMSVVQAGESQMTAAGAHTEHDAGVTVTIDPVVVQNMGVRLGEVTRGPVTREVRAVGFLTAAEPNVRDINLRVSGWIEKLHADTLGMHLEQGAPLFELYSPEVRIAAEELIAARKAMDALPPEADEFARRTTESMLRTSERKLELWGLDDKQIAAIAAADVAPRTVTFTSPITGTLTRKDIVQGAAVEAGTSVMQVTDLSVLWLDAQVYAQDVPFVRLGMPVEAYFESLPGQCIEGEVVFISPEVDPATRTATVRMALPNADSRLRPGAYATAYLTAKAADDAPLVPREAVIDTGARRIVFVAQGEGRFSPRDVEVGASSADGSVQVLSGLSVGERVVVSGQFLLDAESRMREAVQKHLSAGLVGETREVVPEAKPQATLGTTGVDAVYGEYLKLADALEAGQALEVGGLVASTRALLETHGDRAHAVLHAAEAIEGQPTEQQKELFKTLSDAVIALADAAPPEGRLYVVYCPMVKASWLQSHDAVENPYDPSMRACGDVVRAVGEDAAGHAHDGGDPS